MSNTSTNYAELNVTNDDIKEVLAEGPQEPAEAEAAPKKKKNVFYRILALVLAVAPIVCLCLLKANVLVSTSAGYAVYGEKTFLDAFLALFKTNGLADFYKGIAGAPADFGAYKFMGLTVLASGTVGKLMSLFLYAIPAVMVVTVVLMIVALCSGKAAPALARAIAFINFWVYAAYAAAVLAINLYYGMDKTFDIVMLAIAGASLLFYLVFSFIKAGKGTWMTLLLFLLSLAFAGVCVYGVTQSVQAFKTLFASTEDSIVNSWTKGEFYKYAVVALTGLFGLAAVISSIRMSTKKGYTFDLVRYIVHLLLAAALVYFAYTETAFDETKFYLYAFIAVAIAVVQILLVIVVLCVRKKAKKLAATEETAEETETIEESAEEPQEITAEETTEETEATEEETPAETKETPAEETGVYAEAVRYDGPTAETSAPEAEELAQPAEETAAPAAEPAPQPAPVYNYNFTTPAAPQPGASATADYDFYNSRSFDPFIASLTPDEREQFTEIFILKYKGETKNLPEYQVGGDNTEFFRKVFIYLGQYRDRIPDSLLAKMYQFAIRK